MNRGDDTNTGSSSPVFRIGEYELDVPRVELRHNGDSLPIQPLVFDLLRYLIERRDRVVPKDELFDALWGKRVVTEASLTGRIKTARKLLGDDGNTQSMIRTVHGRGYQFVGPVETAEDEATESNDTPPVTVRFVDVRGGVKLAVGETGSGPPLIKVANWLTHIEKDAASPIWGHWVRDLSRRHTFIRYDARGCGLSDRDLKDIALNDLDLWVDDLRNVVDTLGHERFALMGLSQGGPVAVAFAAKYPERVSHLILHGTYARGMKRRDDVSQVSEAALLTSLARFGWGVEDSRYLEVFTRQFVPDAGPTEVQWFNELQRSTCDGPNAAQLEGAMHEVDIQDMARSLEVPTLVTHSVDEVGIAFEEGRLLASLIPDATLLSLKSKNHIMLEREPAWPEFVDAVERFTAKA
ncbi:MAG: alpha/beta fold hydrolase [Woeseiaceae bacterium]|nr:alpha/beta fold hydrolase [Woeseiaceae bacterium]